MYFRGATGTYRFLTGFYGLADMPAEFQQTIDKTLANLPEACAFIDDIIICTKGSPAEHMSAVNRVLNRLNNANLALKLSICEFLLSEVDWLGFRLTQTGIVPLRHKLDGLYNLKRPTTIKQVRGWLGSAHQLTKFIPHLASICYPFRTLLKNGERFHWAVEHTRAFQTLQNALIAISENAHFTPRARTRITSSNNIGPVGGCLSRTHPGS